MPSWPCLALYILVASLDCFFVIKRSADPRATLYSRLFRIFKYLLMPLLALFYVTVCLTGFAVIPAQKLRPLILLSLFFAWGGDCLLELSPKYFPAGVLSFLLGHICYLIQFLSKVSWTNLSPFYLLWVIPLGVFLWYMIRSLFTLPDTRPLRSVLFAYLAVLSLLPTAAVLRLSYASGASAVFCILGSLLFVLSDSLLAFRMFKNVSERGVMVTYTLAQLLLILGLLLE